MIVERTPNLIAMLEIAETFLVGENYDSAIKFYDRLNRLEQLDEQDRSVVQYKRTISFSKSYCHN